MVLIVAAHAAAPAPASAASPARAEGDDGGPAPLKLMQPEALPFSDAQIQGALLARLPPGAGDPGAARLPPIEIEPAGAGLVTVHVRSQSRIVPVGERSGPEAARVVALVIAELMTRDAEETGDGDA